MDKRLERFSDDNLRDIPCDPDGLRQYVREMQELLGSITEVKTRVRILGEVGVHLRSLGDLPEAEEHLLNSLELIQEHQLGLSAEIQQKIRLGHVLQWKREFTKSDALFEEIISTCRSNKEAEPYLAFALQHAGKNFFDQKRWMEALKLFEEALNLRTSLQAPEDQIKSTQQALQRTKEILGLH